MKTSAKSMTKPDRLLAAALRQGDRMADQLAYQSWRANMFSGAAKVALMLIERGQISAAQKLLAAAVTEGEGHGTRR